MTTNPPTKSEGPAGAVAGKSFEVATPWKVREEFQSLVVGDIHGPAFGVSETLPAQPPVRDRYLVGMLAPTEVRVDPAQVDDSGQVNDEAKGDVSSSERVATVGFFPSSLGLSFAADGSATTIQVNAEWGHYRKERRLREDVEAKPGFHILKREVDKDVFSVWQRAQREGMISIKLTDGDIEPRAPVPEQPQVLIKGRVRRHNNAWLVTLFLVNEQPSQKENVDQQWLFQVSMSVCDPRKEPIFIERVAVLDIAPDNRDGEFAQQAMLYRDVVEFAVGHGTGAHAEIAANDPRRATRLVSKSVPTFEVPRTEQPDITKEPRAADVVLDMKGLSALHAADFEHALMPIVTAYRQWIDDQEAKVSKPVARLTGHEDAARQAVSDARAVASRIEAGIGLLGKDANAAEAFRFANEAMWRQRVQQLAIAQRATAKSGDVGEMPLADAVALVDKPTQRSWRLFQLAFICLNLPALAHLKHEDRIDDTALVDLLFFPTGGGKTEAYLGLVAYTLAIRRLQGTIRSDDCDLDGSEGVAVLMRYTLRVLTSQQFQRAAALICACEVIRRERVVANARWGETPFRLGLWIGSSTTPNYTGDSRSAVETARQRDGFTGGYADPLQLTACPWCGSRLATGHDVTIDRYRWRTITTCSDPFGFCPFTSLLSSGEGIPVLTVDEEIYRLLPSFVIATVDKFAQLPWKGPLHLLFGRTYQRCSRHGFRSRDLDETTDRIERDSHKAVNGLPDAHSAPCNRLRPPDLIIQDELHLISGPLGTMVGLYETAIDRLASVSIDGTNVRPKVVASTATIRRATVQASALFQRRLNVFPPAMLDVGNNFFAVQVEPSETTPGRRYVGICARGQRLKAAEARLSISVLAAAELLFQKYGPLADPYMTLVGYFSSLRELAGMRRLLDDDVRERLPKAERRGLGKRGRFLSVGELTSRMHSSDIPKVLDRLTLPHVPGEKTSMTSGPYDVVIATNMISVGVDVPRLGLMIMVGQPKSVAEYIQATSRIGRDIAMPGIVFTLYNWSRPRDLSHYERFEHDHATFYRQVEAQSVTPFSRRALDRGLTAIAIGLVRHEDAHLPIGAATNPERGAHDAPVTDADLRGKLRCIADRVGKVQPNPEDREYVERLIDGLLDAWADRQRLARKEGAPLSYTGKGNKTAALLSSPRPYRWDRWTAPNSLRETEHTINLLLSESDASAREGPSFVLVPRDPQLALPTVEDSDVEEAEANHS